ncbi:hypothetical protein Aperf_G00000011707 [Anoplocephala perfoliata]
MSCQQAFLKFTHDYSALCASWEDGFWRAMENLWKLFAFVSLMNAYLTGLPLDGDAVNNVIRLHNRNLVAVVPIKYPSSVELIDIRRNRLLLDIHYQSSVLYVNMAYNNLVALSFNSSAAFLATASEVGTLIRIFSVTDGTRVMEFRHAYTTNAGICSLNFSEDDVFLTCASKRDTVHVFKLSQLKTQQMYSFDNKYMLIAADNGGNIYLFKFYGEKGGEVTLLKMLRIDDAVKDSSFQQILQQDLINLA